MPTADPAPARRIVVAKIEAAGGDRYVASDWYATRPTDDPPNVFMQARLSAVPYEGGLSFAVWNRNGGLPAISEVELINVDGDLDSWLDEAWKGVRVTFFAVQARQPWSTAEPIAAATVDHIVSVGESRIRLVCRSAAELLDKPVTVAYADDIPNTQLRGQPKPLTFGHVRWCDLVAYRTDGGTGSTRAVLDVADGPIEGVVQILERGAALVEQPDPGLTFGGWWNNQGNNGYGVRARDSSYRLAAEVRGQVRRREQLLAEAELSPSFDSVWELSIFDGSISYSGGGVRIEGDGVADHYIAQVLTGLTTGALYQIEVELDSQAGSANIDLDGAVLRTIEAAGGYKVVCSFEAAASAVELRFGIFVGQTGTLIVTAIRCYACTRIDTLAEVLLFAASRVGIDTSEVPVIGAAEGDFASSIAAWASATSIPAGATAGASWSAGAALLQANATGAAGPAYVDFYFPATLAPGRSYSYAMTVSATMTAGGLVQVQFRPDDGAPADFVQLLVALSSGSYTLSGGFVAPAAGRLFVRCGAAAGASASATLDNVRLSYVDAGIDLAAARQIDEESGYRLALHTSREITGTELVRLACNSFGVALFQDRLGVLKPVRLQAPAAVADFSIEHWRVKGGIEVEVDLAPGLSTRMAYARNYAPHSEEDAQLASAALRAELTREQLIATTSVTLDPLYADAAGREPIESILADLAAAQAEIDRLCGLYTVPRKFWTLTDVDASDTVDAVRVQQGQTVRVTHPRHGLAAGKNLLVVYRRSPLESGRVTLICWG